MCLTITAHLVIHFKYLLFGVICLALYIPRAFLQFFPPSESPNQTPCGQEASSINITRHLISIGVLEIQHLPNASWSWVRTCDSILKCLNVTSWILFQCHSSLLIVWGRSTSPNQLCLQIKISESRIYPITRWKVSLSLLALQMAYQCVEERHACIKGISLMSPSEWE